MLLDATRYSARFAKLVAERTLVVAADESGRAMITESGCTALNNVCEVAAGIPELKQKIESTLVELHQQQCKAIRRIMRLDPAGATRVITEKEQMAKVGQLVILTHVSRMLGTGH